VKRKLGGAVSVGMVENNGAGAERGAGGRGAATEQTAGCISRSQAALSLT